MFFDLKRDEVCLKRTSTACDGDSGPAKYNSDWPAIKVNEIPVVDKHGLTRNIGVRYTHQYPLENNEWGEFQVNFSLYQRGLPKRKGG